MSRRSPYLVPTVLLVAAAAALAAGAVLLLPEGWLRWVPAGVGAGWTVGMVVLARRARAEGAAAPRDLRGGVVACGLLTALAVSWAVRDRVGAPELLLLSAALVAFAFWARAMARERRRRRHAPPAPPGPVLRLRDRPPSTRWH